MLTNLEGNVDVNKYIHFYDVRRTCMSTTCSNMLAACTCSYLLLCWIDATCRRLASDHQNRPPWLPASPSIRSKRKNLNKPIDSSSPWLSQNRKNNHTCRCSSSNFKFSNQTKFEPVPLNWSHGFAAAVTSSRRWLDPLRQRNRRLPRRRCRCSADAVDVAVLQRPQRPPLNSSQASEQQTHVLCCNFCTHVYNETLSPYFCLHLNA